MIRMRADDELRIPFTIEPVRQTLDDIQRFGVSIYQRERGTFEFL